MTTDVAVRRKRGFALGLIALVLVLVPAILFALLLTIGYSDGASEQLAIDVGIFAVPVALFASAVVAIVAIALGSGRALGVVSLVLFVPQVLFVGFAVYAIFGQNRGLF